MYYIVFVISMCVYVFSSVVNHEWKLISQTPKNNPGPRYEHSALVYNKAMWIFGGLENYQSKSDLWKWTFGEYIKRKYFYLLRFLLSYFSLDLL